MIELQHATKKYGPVTALNDVSFRVSKGETIGLLGQNGAGKTTCLNLMTGYFPPTAGTVRVGGKDMRTAARECRRMIGYLPEQPPLYDEMTVAEYLRFVCSLREVQPKAVAAHVDDIIHICGLQEMRKRLLGHLSKGYRQRAGIAQALCGSPEILIFDEPTVGLDPRQTVEIRNLISGLSKGHTVVFSSHILSEVQLLCSRVIILNEGCMALDYDSTRPHEEDTIRFRVQVAGDPQKVMNRLAQLDPDIEAEQIPAKETDLAEARLILPRKGNGGAEADRVFRLLASAGLPVRMMKEEKETLEELFLRITDGKTEQRTIIGTIE